MGCGSGEPTRRLAQLLPEMLPKEPGFELAHIEDFQGHYDLIFSYAALQGVDHHPALFSELWSCLKPGGQLLVQMPYKFEHASHQSAARVALSLGQTVRNCPKLAVEDYARLLFDLGAVLADAITAYTVTPEFLEADQAEVRRACPSSPVFYGFKRLLLTASKP